MPTYFMAVLLLWKRDRQQRPVYHELKNTAKRRLDLFS